MLYVSLTICVPIDALTFTTSVTTPLPPTPNAPTFQVTVPVPPTGGALVGAGVADTNVVFAGVTSLTIVFVAVDSPVLPNAIVYVRLPVGPTGSGPAVLPT